MSFIRGQSDPLFRATIEELLSRFRGRNPSGVAVGQRWRIIEGAYPKSSDPNSILLQHIDGTEWKTDLGVRPDKTDTLRCYAAYTRNASTGQTMTDNAFTIADYDVREEDTDNAVVTGTTWKFTCPVHKGGLYLLDASWHTIFGTAIAVESYILTARKNNVEFARGTRFSNTTGVSASLGAVVSSIVRLSPGDNLNIQAFQTSGANRASQAGVFNRVTICRISLY